MDTYGTAEIRSANSANWVGLLGFDIADDSEGVSVVTGYVGVIVDQVNIPCAVEISSANSANLGRVWRAGKLTYSDFYTFTSSRMLLSPASVTT